jgi:hypothetical protein
LEQVSWARSPFGRAGQLAFFVAKSGAVLFILVETMLSRSEGFVVDNSEVRETANPSLSFLLRPQLFIDLAGQGISTVCRDSPRPDADVLDPPEQGADARAAPFCLRVTMILARSVFKYCSCCNPRIVARVNQPSFAESIPSVTLTTRTLYT